MKPGRPKETEGLELITLDECLERAKEYLKLEEYPWSRKTLQNKLSRGEFTRYGTYRHILVDWSEFRRALNWRKGKRTG
jgi:hypothetical protein